MMLKFSRKIFLKAILTFVIIMAFKMIGQVFVYEKSENSFQKLIGLDSITIIKIDIQFSEHVITYLQSRDEYSIDTFCTSFSDCEDWEVNRPMNPIKLFVTCNNGQKFKFSVFFHRSDKTVNILGYKNIIGLEIKVSNFKSKLLYKWFKQENIVKKLNTSEYQHRAGPDA